MNFIINPGSQIATEAIGWKNTHTQAKKYAYSWFYKPMLKAGFRDILVTDTGEETKGRWKFIFEHTVTGKAVELEIHGIDDLKAYEKQNIFTPRVYWNGSSSSDPDIEQFAAPGYKPVLTYVKDAEELQKEMQKSSERTASTYASPEAQGQRE